MSQYGDDHIFPLHEDEFIQRNGNYAVAETVDDNQDDTSDMFIDSQDDYLFNTVDVTVKENDDTSDMFIDSQDDYLFNNIDVNQILTHDTNTDTSVVGVAHAASSNNGTADDGGGTEVYDAPPGNGANPSVDQLADDGGGTKLYDVEDILTMMSSADNVFQMTDNPN